MGSRVRENPDKLFEVFAEVGRPEQEGSEPFILQKYPPDYDEQDVLNNIPKFSFPCRINTPQVDQFAFVLTDLESLYRFGFCRHGTGAQTCLCILSHLPWYEVFYKMLNFLAEIVNRSENNDLLPFLKAAYEQNIPTPEEPVTIVAGQDMFNFTAPDSTCLPSIPASRNLTEYYNAVDTNNMMRIFASMLHERRIIMTSKKLSRVTACIHAAEALLYPMHWQHLYIPVLPEHLVDYVTAPMPYLIGVHTTLMEKVLARRMEIGDAVIVDADKNEVSTEYEDLEALPEDVSSYLKRHLKTQRVQTSMMDCGDAISMAFLQALVRLIGGYRDALKIRDGEPITFDRDAFVQTRSSQSMQVFLENMLHLQIFQQFINGRLELLNEGEGLTELFEMESVKYADSLNTQSKYKEWLARVSKQKRKLKAGGKDIISDMRERMKQQGKKVMSKVKEINENKMSSRKMTGGIIHSRQPRPSTIAGSRLTTSRPPRPAPPPSGSSQGQTVRVRSQLSVEDDSHLRLSYHSIDVSLMTDADIQHAMMRSASAEHLPPLPDSPSSPQHHHNHESFVQSASEDDISSTPSSEALSPSDDNLTNIPYLDMASTSSQSGCAHPPTSSSKEDLTRSQPQPPLPAKDTSDRLISTDRLILPKPSLSAPPVAPPRNSRRSAESRSGGSSPQPSPQPSRPTHASSRPRCTSQENVGGVVSVETAVRAPEKPLIQFESSESEADSIEQFDPLHIKGRRSLGSNSTSTTTNTTAATAADSSPPPQGLSRNRSSRNSLMRSGAFRKVANDAPVRAGYREDKALDDARGSKEMLADLFDPLASSTSTTVLSRISSSAKTSDQSASRPGGGEGSGSGSLMQDWTLNHLGGGGTGLNVMPVSGGGQFPRPASTGSAGRVGLPRVPSGGAGFSRVPSGGTLTCPVTAMSSTSSTTFPPRSASPMTSLTSAMTSLTSNPLYVAPTSGMQSNPLYRSAAACSNTTKPHSQSAAGRGIVQSNPLYHLARASHPGPNPSTANPWSSPGASQGQTMAGKSTTAGLRSSVQPKKLQQSPKFGSSDGGSHCVNPAQGPGVSGGQPNPARGPSQPQPQPQPQPPGGRVWETFD